jgi:Fic family protein
MKEKLGFGYSPRLFASARTKIGVERACARFAMRFPQYIWNESVAAGKAYTFPQVKTLVDGVTTGGRRMTEQQDINNQRQSLERLVRMVRTSQFDVSQSAFCSLHEVAAKQEALSWGVFRAGSVGIAGTQHEPPPPDQLNQIFADGIKHIQSTSSIAERGITFFLFGAFHQFFYDVNKRTSRLMMNGILMAGGQDALVIDARRRFEYNAAMVHLYEHKDADPAIQFLLDSYRSQDYARPGNE